ncbi:MAG: D-2-hydroxyacid dehydrogenase [Roseburia sp.]|nr:D-2-hydroxyacid dehydrogenase [Roseburia sp.]
MKIVVLEKASLGNDIDISFFDDFGEVEYYDSTALEEVGQRVADAEIIIASKIPFNASTLGNTPKLRLICETATGYNNVDLEYCKARGIRVANVVDYCTSVVAQHTLAMTLYLMEKLPVYDAYVKKGAYGRGAVFTYFEPYFTELYGKTWGIIGLGNIGRKVAQMAQVFGCRVIYYSASGKNTSTAFERVDFDTLLAESDILSLHCPLTERTERIINAQALEKMKRTAILINVARGPVVDGQALYDALVSGKLAAAGLDVLEKEPIAADNPLGRIQDSTKLLITPHMAWASREARERCAREVYKNIESFLQGEERNLVV